MILGKAEIGRSAENAALEYLRAHGLVALSSNYRCRWGEIDLICAEQQTIVFVEVRYRERTNLVRPEQTVIFRKQQRLIKTALHFLQHHRAARQPPCRFDIVAVTGDLLRPHIDWVRDAFQA